MIKSKLYTSKKSNYNKYTNKKQGFSFYGNFKRLFVVDSVHFVLPFLNWLIFFT